MDTIAKNNPNLEVYAPKLLALDRSKEKMSVVLKHEAPDSMDITQYLAKNNSKGALMDLLFEMVLHVRGFEDSGVSLTEVDNLSYWKILETPECIRPFFAGVLH